MESLFSIFNPRPLPKFSSSSSSCSKLYTLSISAISTPSRERKTPTLRRSSKSTKIISPTTTTTTISTTNATSPSSKKVLVPIGFGTEEMEAVILIGVLRRAGADVVVASVEPQLEVEASCGIRLVADASISSCAEQIFDLVALPGGMPGSARLRDCEILRDITIRQAEKKRLFGAICAAPAVTLLPWGLLRRKQTTCHPAFSDKLPTFWAVKSTIQVSGELTTSRGPGTSFVFGLSLVEQLFGESAALDVGKSLLVHGFEENSRKEEFNKVEWSVNHIPRVLVPVANGSEDIEVVTIVDVLRRANINVVVASVEKSLQILAAQNTKIVADKLLNDAAELTFDLILIPGGVAGVERLNKSRTLKKLLKEQGSAGRIYGAICSSLGILHGQGLLKDKRATAHPSFTSDLPDAVTGANVVIDGRLITSRGLATVIDLALAIVQKFYGHARARSVAEGLVYDYPRN